MFASPLNAASWCIDEQADKIGSGRPLAAHTAPLAACGTFVWNVQAATAEGVGEGKSGEGNTDLPDWPAPAVLT